MADPPLLDAALAGGGALDRALGVSVAESWDVFPRSLVRVREQLAAEPQASRWGSRLFLGDEPEALAEPSVHAVIAHHASRARPVHARAREGWLQLPRRGDRRPGPDDLRFPILDGALPA